MNHSFHRFSYVSVLISIIFNSCGFFESKKEDNSNTPDENQDEVFLFRGKTSSDSQLMHSIYLGKDSMVKWELPVEIDTMSTRQWAYVKDKNSTLSILIDSINLETNEGINDLERVIGFQEIYFEPEILTTLDSFKAELFGEILEFNVEQGEKLSSSDELWTGILDKENSSFTIYKSDSIYSASFYYDETKYEIKKEGQNYFVKRINQEVFYDEDEPLYEMDFDEDDDGLDDQGFLKDSNEFVDVLVCYTKTAMDSSGGLSSINSEIGLAIAETNLSYKNSKVKHKLRLVGKMELDYNESESSKSDVKWIQKNLQVNNKRNEVRADLVVFIVEKLYESCGRAFAVPKSISPKFAPFAYCVVKRSCATGYYSFGHEVAHLMGGRHDCLEDNKLTPFDFNHGYEYCNTEKRPYRTVMSYNNCGSTRIPYWSNPNINYKNQPMGNIDSEEPCKSNNARLLNQTSLVTANFRTQPTIQEIN